MIFNYLIELLTQILNLSVSNITVIIVFIGWFVIHELSARRDKRNKQRDIRINYLISAYRTLADCSQRKPLPEYYRKMESALTDIQLFGDEQQIEMAKKFMNEYEENRKNAKGGFFEVPLDDLLNNIRNNLREEMNLSAIKENTQWFRPEGDPMMNKDNLKNCV